MYKRVNHQFSLFPFQQPKFKTKSDAIGVQAAKDAKKAFEKGDFKLSALKIEEAREALERKYGV